MKLTKFISMIFVVIALANIVVGAGWRPSINLLTDPVNIWQFPAALTVDNLAIHCGSPHAFYKCGNELYARSTDNGSNWSNVFFNRIPGWSYATPPPVYIASNLPYIHYLTYPPYVEEMKIRTSDDGGITWPEDWSNLPTSPYPSSTPSSCRLENSFYIIWSDGHKIPNNDEIFFFKTDNGGNTWYSYDSNPELPQRLTFAEGKSIFPDAAVNSYGIHLVWTDNRSDPTSPTAYEIYYKYSTDGGQNWSSDQQLTENRPDSSFYPAITAYNNGLHVVFQDKREGENLIYYKRSLDNGQTWQDEYVIGGGVNPDVSADQDGLHVVYEYNGTIRYRRSSDYGNTWSWYPNGMNISMEVPVQDTFYSCLPRICADFRGRHVVWYNQRSCLRYRQYDILPPEAPRNFRIKYITELHGNNVEICLDWVANTEADLSGYNIYRRPIWSCWWTKLNQVVITENSYCDTIPYYEAYCYYVSAVDETENESEQSNIVTYLPPDYKSDIGKSEPSVYLIERDSFIQWEDNSAQTADIDNTELVYRFTDLNSDAEYEIGFVYYRGDNEERTQSVTVDDIELQEVNIPATPEMYVFPLPQSIYDDEIINIHIDKITGPNVILSEIYLWEIVPSGGQSGGKTGFNQFGLTLKPNIFKNSTKISYQLPMQSQVSLRIFNSTGRLIKTLINKLASKGTNRFEWNGKDEYGRDISAGVYIVWLSVNNNITTKRLLVVK